MTVLNTTSLSIDRLRRDGDFQIDGPAGSRRDCQEVDGNDGKCHQLGDKPSQKRAELTAQRPQPYGSRANGAAPIPVGVQAREHALHDDRRMSQYGLPAKDTNGPR